MNNMKVLKDLKHYIELNVDDHRKAISSAYLLFDRFKVKRPKDASCPAKSLVIFAHN